MKNELEKRDGIDDLDEPHRLKDNEKMLVFRLWAEGWGAVDIVREVLDQYKIKTTRQTVCEICKKENNQIFIDEFRERYFASIKMVPIANKRIRLDALDRNRVLLLKMMDQLCRHRTGLPQTENTRAQVLMIMKRLNETVCVAREEIEGKSHIIQQINVGNYSGLSDAELQRRKDDIIAKATGTYQARDLGINEDSEGTGN